MRYCIVFLVGLIGVTTSADVINVPGDQPTIELATDVAVPGDEIIVAPGTYPGGDNLSAGGYTIVSSGGSGVTFIDGEGIRYGWSNGERTTLIEGFTFQNCFQSALIGATVVRNCVFRNNSSEGTRGAIYVISADPVLIESCLFEGNSATGKGAAISIISSSNGLVRFVNCTFRGNTARWGGAVYTESVFLKGTEFLNCVFEQNSAERGGGAVFISSSDPSFINCTFDGNAAAVGGPAIYSVTFSLPTVSNSIFTNHTTTAIVDSDSLTTVTFSVISAAWSNATSFGNISVDPSYVDSANGDFRLLPDSPCIDAGFNWAIPESLAELDLDGLPRYADRTATPDTGCGFTFVVDMGAYEFQGIPGSPCRGDTDGSGNTNVTDLLTLLASWGMSSLSGCFADFDGNGLINVSDLLALLAAWGACP